MPPISTTTSELTRFDKKFSCACSAWAMTCIPTDIWVLVPKFAWSIFRSVIFVASTFSVTKSRLPSSSRRPWNAVTWEIRSMASSDESTCNWLAAICSALRAPVFAASETNPRTSFRSELTWPSELSAVAII